MKRITTLLTSLGVFLCLTTLPVFAQQGQGGNPGMGQGGGVGQPGGDMGRPGMEQPGMGPDGPMETGGMHPNSTQPRPENTISTSTPTKALSSNPKLKSTLQQRLGSMLPSGMDVAQAANGFKNLGQFVAAVHVSHDLDIPFTQLKDKVTSGEKLGKAVKTLKPSSNVKSEVKKAKKEAKSDIKEART